MGFPGVCIQGTAAPGLPNVGVRAQERECVTSRGEGSSHLSRAPEVPGLPKEAQAMVPALRNFRGRRGKKNPRPHPSEIDLCFGHWHRCYGKTAEVPRKGGNGTQNTGGAGWKCVGLQV